MIDHAEVMAAATELFDKKTSKATFLARQLIFSALPASYFVENFLYDNEGRLQNLGDFPMLRQVYDNMPQKLVLKCSRKTLKSTLISNLICLNLIRWNYYKMMYIGPQELTVKYFSSNYLPPRFESPRVKRLMVKGWDKNDVFEKIMGDTRSSVLFRYVKDDATRTRGPAIDSCVFDECFSGGTLTIVNKTGFEKKILDLHIGEEILAHDEYGVIKTDKVKAISAKGKRPCWKITLSNGAFLECTSNERILTNRGWVYLTQLLQKNDVARCGKASAFERMHSTAKATDIGDIAGGWVDDHDCETPMLSCEPRDKTTGACITQSEGARELHPYTPGDCAKPRLWHTERSFFYGDFSSIRVYTYDVLRKSRRNSQQEDYTGVAGPTDVGGDSLLVYGRRQSRKEIEYNAEHPEFHKSGDRTACSMADLSRDTCLRQEGREVLGCCVEEGCGDQIHNQCETLRDPSASLQMRHHTEILPVWGTAEYGASSVQGLSPSGEGGPQGGMGSYTERKEQKQPGICREAASQRPEVQSFAQTGPSPLSETSRVLEGDWSQAQAGPGLEGEEEHAGKNSTSSPEGEKILSIEYIGEIDVYDLETEKYHTFFANGLAVHNCQDIDYNCIEIVQETMALSPYKREIFAGTPLDTTNTLNRIWKKSSQLEWMMKCGSCGHWNSLTEGNEPMKMVQPKGLCCSKCLSIINSRNGEWAATGKSDAPLTGYHLAQPILPFFNENEKEWREIYEKVHGAAREMKTIMNETFGLVYDIGTKPITEEELRKLCVLGPIEDGSNKYTILQRNKRNYGVYTVGVDWGVSMSQSRTVATAGGMRSDGIFEVYWAKIFRGFDHEAHIQEIADVANLSGAYCVADSGPDPIRGIKLCELTSPARSQLATYRRTKVIQSTDIGEYDWRQNRWVLHRSDVISLVIRQLKAGKILFPQWDDMAQYMQDILNIYIEVRDGIMGQELVYDHHDKQPDDAMHSLLFAVCAAYMAVGDPCLHGPSSTSAKEY